MPRRISFAVLMIAILFAMPLQALPATVAPASLLVHSPVVVIEANGTPTGSGFVVSSNAQESYIITAAHVLGCDTEGTGCTPAASVVFSDALPRTPTGKLYKRLLREPYWRNRDAAI